MPLANNATQFNENNLVWIDLEMTGLDPEKCLIIEIATIVTDSELNILAEGPVLAIHQDKAELDKMDEWCTTHHTNSGLVKRVLASEVTEKEAVEQTLAFLHKWVPAGKSPLCGNSIGQDRRFLVKYMTELNDYFHYRNVDVSKIKELGRRWCPEVISSFHKQGLHLALDDIRESIGQSQHYRQHMFKI